MSPAIKHQNLQIRTKQFALQVIRFCEGLPKDEASRILARQVLRSGTSVGANYRPACRARSRAQFVAKLRTVLEEADESLCWLELIRDGELMPGSKIPLLLKEANELTAILAAGKKSAASNRTSNIRHLT